METLAYLHLAIAHEAPTDPNNTASTPIWNNPKLLTWLNPVTLSTRAALPLVSLSVVFGLLGMAKQASAAIKQGDRGTDVVELQQRLQKLGYFKSKATGYFGPVTKQALLKFQQSQGLTPDGVAGASTQEYLNKQTQVKEPPSPTWQLGDRGAKVSEIQKTLAMTGYPSSTSGVFDQQTQEAVKLFQQAQGLRVDGVIGKETLAALENPEAETKPPFQPQQTNPWPPIDEQTPATPEEPTQTQATQEEPTQSIWKLGDRGAKVSEIQQKLVAAGYLSGTDGVFDGKTQQAVQQFQQAKGLKVDGIVGENTLTALAEKPEPKPMPEPEKNITWHSIEEPTQATNEEFTKNIWKLGDRGAKVSEIQQKLVAAGYPGSTDGVFNPPTEAAVRQFQQAKGLKVDGIVGEETLLALENPSMVKPQKTTPWYEDESAPLNPFTR